MEVSLIILAALVGTGILLYLHHRFWPSPQEKAPQEVPATPQQEQEECCGMHISCERDSLLASVSPEIVYYDDEELDTFAGRSPQDYTWEEEEMFRDVLLTLIPSDIAGWGRSLQLRGISLPAAVREELLLIVSEERARLTH